MHKEVLKIRKGCIQFDIVDKPYANRCQTQTDTVQTLLRSVRYLSHSEAEAYKPYANEGKSHKSLGELALSGVIFAYLAILAPIRTYLCIRSGRPSSLAI